MFSADYICGMSKYFRFCAASVLMIVLVSWGYEGHHAVGIIAERHLTPKAAQAVKQLLGADDIADVSVFADEIRNQAQYKETGPFHYFDLPGGLTYDEFESSVKNSHSTNVYTGILAAVRDLQNPAKTKFQKTFALKMLIHFVGDAHQPMHIGHVDDRGGNKIGVKFFSQSTDLHSLWDEGMILHQNMPYKEFAIKYDDATPEQIKKWQSDSVIIWLWESYQIAGIFYQEAADDPNFGEDYYKLHLPILKSRIEKAGIRLAGLLNDIYK